MRKSHPDRHSDSYGYSNTDSDSYGYTDGYFHSDSDPDSDG